MAFFGVAALILGALVAAGLDGPLWFQLLLFSALSILSLATLRGPILRKLKASPQEPDPVDSPVGELVVLLEDLPPLSEGRAEFRGTFWTVRNVDDGVLTKGQRCAVTKVQGLKLFIRAS